MKRIFILLLCTSSFGLGLLCGWYGFYQYSNHLYLKHPDFFLMLLNRKIEKKSKNQP